MYAGHFHRHGRQGPQKLSERDLFMMIQFIVDTILDSCPKIEVKGVVDAANLD